MKVTHALVLLLAVLAIVASAQDHGLDDTEAEVSDAPLPAEESKELKLAKGAEQILILKHQSVKALYDSKAKPFAKSERLLEAEENSTKAEEELHKTESELDEMNQTVIEDRVELNESSKIFGKENRTMTILVAKIKALRKSLTVALQKQSELRVAHQAASAAYNAHTLADIKIKLADDIRRGAESVDAGKKSVLELKKKLRARISEIKARLQGGKSPYIVKLEATIAAEREALAGLPKSGQQYEKHLAILDTAIADMKRVNSTAVEVNSMKKDARALAKSIKAQRDDLDMLEATVHKNAKKLQDLALNGVAVNETTGEMPLPNGIVSSKNAALLRSKATFIKDLALDMNVTGIERSVNETERKLKKRNATFSEAKAMYEETKRDLEDHTFKLEGLIKNLSAVENSYKRTKRASMNMKVAELAMHKLDKMQAAELLREAEIKMKLGKERVQRAEEVLTALSNAMKASGDVSKKMKELLEVPKNEKLIPDPTLAPSLATPTKTEEGSPVQQAIHNLINHAVWGNDEDTAHMEAVLRQSFAKRGQNVSQAMKFRGHAMLRRTNKAVEHCHDGVKNFDETGVDCGGSCQRQCGFHRVGTIPGTSADSEYHVVKNIIPNPEARGSETESPQMVKTLKEMLAPGADISTKSSVQFYGTVPVMNDGEFQKPLAAAKTGDHHRFRETWHWSHQKLRGHP
jgi:hypothetical protein